MTAKTEWGVQHPDGRIEAISEASANEGYMTAEQYAERRAAATGGVVVTRVRRETVTKWKLR